MGSFKSFLLANKGIVLFISGCLVTSIVITGVSVVVSLLSKKEIPPQINNNPIIEKEPDNTIENNENNEELENIIPEESNQEENNTSNENTNNNTQTNNNSNNNQINTNKPINNNNSNNNSSSNNQINNNSNNNLNNTTPPNNNGNSSNNNNNNNNGTSNNNNSNSNNNSSNNNSNSGSNNSSSGGNSSSNNNNFGSSNSGNNSSGGSGTTKPPQEDTNATVPDVAGMSISEAVRTLQENGFMIFDENIEIESEDIEKGKVVKTSPPANVKRKKGTTITLYVSLGKLPRVIVEDYTGKHYREIKGKLETLGVNVIIESKEVENVNDYEVGMIIDQSVKVGEELYDDDTITLYIPAVVSRYPNFTDGTYTITDVEDFAESYELNLTVEFVTTTEHDDGTIFYQSRPEGYQIIAGQAFRIKVAKNN